jgi:hypothetical protein
LVRLVTSAPRLERRDARLRQLRDAVAARYMVHPSVLAELSEDTLVWMDAFRARALAHVGIYRVE